MARSAKLAQSGPAVEAGGEDARLATARALHLSGQLDAAEAAFGALLASSGAAEALQRLGLIRYQKGDAAAALPLLQAGEALEPGPRITHNVAVVLGALGRKPDAAEAFRRNIAQNPDYLASYGALAGLLAEAGDRIGAAGVLIAQAEKALAGRHAEGVAAAVDSLLALDIDHPGSLLLANRLRISGFGDQAALLLQAALRRAPDDLGLRLTLAMARLAVIYGSTEEIEARRASYIGDLEAAGALAETVAPDALARAAQAVGNAKPFYLSYQGRDDRDLQRLYGRVAARAMAAAYPPAAHRRAGNGRIRVGFATGYFHIHSVSKLFGGWIRELDRSRFEVIGYNLGQGEDATCRALAVACDGFRSGLADHEAWAAAIAADSLDVLIYPEIGMHPVAVQLACRRLAPVQCSSWGHPVTSGLPEIDYFLTSALMEPEDGEAHYTEALVRLPNLSICYEPLPSEGGRLTRAELGLAEDAVVYVCCQALYKYLPAHDGALAAIAAKVPKAQFLFIGDLSDVNAAATRSRLSAAFTAAGLDPARHLVFARPVAFELFPSLLRLGDVYLDSIGWSGGNTTLEAVACNLPVVTWPTGLMRGRHSAAILTMMGCAEEIASDEADYVARAVRLADPKARARAAARIGKSKSKLYGDLAPVRALETFLESALAKAAPLGAAA